MLRPQLRLATSVIRDTPLRRLTIGHLTSYSATWVYALAVATAAYGRGGAEAAGLVYAGRILPGGVFASFAGTLTARLPRQRLLFGASLARAFVAGLTCLALVADAPLPLLVVFSAAVTLLSSVARPAHQSALPMLAEAEQLVAANAITNLLENVSTLVSPALAAVILINANTRVALVVATAGFLAATLVELRLPRLEVVGDPTVARSRAGVLVAWREVLSEPAMRCVLALTVVTLPLFGAMNVIILALGADRLGRPAAGGLLLAAYGLGGVVGAVPALSLVRKSPQLALCGGAALLGAAFVAAALSPLVLISCIGFGIAGLGSTITEVAAETITQRLFTGDALVRVLGVIFSVAWTTMAFGGLIAPLLIAAMGVLDAATLIGGVALATALAVSVLVHRTPGETRAGIERVGAPSLAVADV
jgi:hypothetical protein